MNSKEIKEKIKSLKVLYDEEKFGEVHAKSESFVLELFKEKKYKSIVEADKKLESVPIIPDARLRECNYGKYNAQPSAIVEPMQEKMITERFPEGEGYEDVKARMADFLDFLKQNYDGKSIAIIAHKAPQLALDVLLKGKTWEQAFAEDWRKTKAWRPGWEYVLD